MVMCDQPLTAYTVYYTAHFKCPTPCLPVQIMQIYDIIKRMCIDYTILSGWVCQK